MFKRLPAVLYQHFENSVIIHKEIKPFIKQLLNLEAQPRVLDADKARSASILNGIKNNSFYNPTGEKSLEIKKVYVEKMKVKVSVNQQNCISMV